MSDGPDPDPAAAAQLAADAGAGGADAADAGGPTGDLADAGDAGDADRSLVSRVLMETEPDELQVGGGGIEFNFTEPDDE